MSASTITSGLAGEAGHWYKADGSPAYQIEAKNGSMRAVTLRDARKHNLYPSVTTILRCAHAPGLEQWKIRQAVMAALTLPRHEHEPDDEYVARILADSREQGIAAAAEGTAIHESIEKSFTAPDSVIADHRPHVDAVRAWLDATYPDAEWAAEHSFSDAHGYGGKIDLYSPTDRVAIDFKTKEFDDPKGVRGYDEQGMQLAAYAAGLFEDEHYNEVERVNLFVSRTVPGLICAYHWPVDTFSKHLGMFYALLDYWQISKGYSPEVPGSE